MSHPSLTSSQLLLFTERYNLQKRSQGIALVLCILLGAIGAHRFYLRKNISGTIYLLFSWSLIPAILSIADIFLISSQVRQYNNQQALLILQNIDPSADPELSGIYTKYENKFLIYLGRVLALAAGALFAAEMYAAIIYDVSPTDVVSSLRNIGVHRPKALAVVPDYYTLRYDEVNLATTLKEAQKLGYTQCNHNNIYTICANPKTNYPNFLNFPVKFALLQFDSQNNLLSLHIYMEKLPSYRTIVNSLSSEEHGSKISTDYLSIAGSHEQITLNTIESSIIISDQKVVNNYEKYLQSQKLLDNND